MPAQSIVDVSGNEVVELLNLWIHDSRSSLNRSSVLGKIRRFLKDNAGEKFHRHYLNIQD